MILIPDIADATLTKSLLTTVGFAPYDCELTFPASKKKVCKA